MSVDPAVAARFAAVPVNAHFGFALRAHDATGAEIAFAPRPEHVLTGLFTYMVMKAGA